jgi:thioredoxin 1
MGEKMAKKTQYLFSALLFFSIPLLILLFSYQLSLSQSSPDRIPKEIAKISLPKLLDFGRGKCIPCKAMAPILQELSEEYKGRVIIKIIEIYEERELTMVNRIRLIPTQIFFDAKNQEVFRHEGFMDKEQIKKIFQKMGVQ